MDLITRTILAFGLLLLICSLNIWVLRSIYSIFRGGDVVVAPFQIIGDADIPGAVGNGLPQLVLNRLSTLERDLDNAQQVLIASGRRALSASAKSPTVSAAPLSASAPSIGLPRFFDAQGIAGLETRLLEPIDINLKVGGVEVSRFIPAVQRWLVKDKILTFSLLYQGDQVIVSGDLEAFGGTRGQRIWLKLSRADTDRIVEKIALGILHRKVLARSRSSILGSPQSELDVIDENDFETLVTTVISAAGLNRRIETFGVPQSAEFARLLGGVEALTIKMPRWDALNHLAATIAEGAGDRARALAFYQKLAASPDRAIAQAEWLATKLAALREVDSVAVDDGRRQIESDVAFATDFLNALFGTTLSPPEVQILAKDFRNAYWDGERLHLPPQAQHIPDLTYHEAA